MSLEHFTRDETPVGKCGSVTEWFPLCIVDICTIVVVVVFIWYVIWGVPMTISFVRRCAWKRSASQCKAISPFHVDTEKDGSSSDMKGTDWDSEYAHDPYLSPSQKLYSFLRRDRSPPIPRPVFSPVKASEKSAIFKSGEDSSFALNFLFTPTKSASSSMSPLESFDYSMKSNLATTSTPFSARDRTVGLGTSLSFCTPLPCRPPAALGRGATVGRAICKPCTW